MATAAMKLSYLWDSVSSEGFGFSRAATPTLMTADGDWGSKLGIERVFPDLHSPSSSSPLGDRFYDELLPSLRRAGLTLHQIRHFFGNELKQKRVSAEIRADLLGHAGKSETTERYCAPISILNQIIDLENIPVLTNHLQPRPIRLLPWVEAGEIAPWSRAAREMRY